MVLTAAMIATAARGELTSGSADRVIDGFSIDSRTLQRGDLFFAIVAARDGHEFVSDAFAQGAIGAVVGPGFSPVGLVEADPHNRVEEPIVIQVSDTTRALQDLGKFVRRESAATVVAITGSAGKTTTKETIAALLSDRYRVIRNKGNLNNHLGLPLSLLELRRGAEIAVMELGMNHAGEIQLLVTIAEPEVRVWTNVGDAHLGFFESAETMADAKAEILDGATAADVLVCNADDPLVMERVRSFPGRTITFGLSEAADVRGEAIEDLGLEGTRARLRTSEGSVDIHVPLLGKGNLSNVLAAAAVATELDVSLDQIAAKVRRLQPANRRGAVLRLPNGITVIDDSYNSSPTALKRVLEVVRRDQGAARKAAVLGEMLELGDHAVRLHQECGRAAAAAGLDRLVVVGGEPAKALADAAVQSGLHDDAVSWTTSSGAASDLIAPWLRAGDLVLIKGSRGIQTDLVVDRIIAEFS
jgi:UDP-N-acetylmuramoyl-tripeptide--D-alanyl-D-alanine ligase